MGDDVSPTYQITEAALRARVRATLKRIEDTRDDGVYAKAYVADIPALLKLLDEKEAALVTARSGEVEVIVGSDDPEDGDYGQARALKKTLHFPP